MRKRRACMMIDTEKTNFQERAVRLIELLGENCQRQTMVAIQRDRKAATTEDIVLFQRRWDITYRCRVLYEFI